MIERQVILTDEQGKQTGLAEIVAAHSGTGQLHRAFSVYIFDKNMERILVQQRAATKMLFASIWANTCCSHPFPKEDTIQAGERRLQEECGFSVPLQERDSFVYKAEDPKGNGIEYEHDTLLVGTADVDISLKPNPAEIAQLEWRKVKDILNEMEVNPDRYAPWFHIGLQKLMNTEETES